jgi:predicted DNA-binding protein (MmcQ/YjbR family)
MDAPPKSRFSRGTDRLPSAEGIIFSAMSKSARTATRKKTAVRKSAPKAAAKPVPRTAEAGLGKTAKAPGKDKLTEAEAALRSAGMAFPEVTEDFPWGHRTLKVKGKAFIFMSREGGVFGLSVKLPNSADFALMQPFAKSTGYGLGKSGWVSASFGKGDAVPVPLLLMWLKESYRAIAPKKLAALVAP